VTRIGPLDNPRLRIKRAGDHLANLKRRIDAYEKAHEGSVLIRVEQGNQVSLQGMPEEPPPRVLGVLIGETVQNLRTALDYLVYALAWFDTGPDTAGERKTQFPICDSPGEYKRKAKIWLEGVSDDHAAAIEWLQPYKGRKWLASLRDISNLDKHNVVPVAGGVTGRASVPIGLPDVYVKAAGGFRKPGDESVYYKSAVRVTFSDGPPVVDVLQVFKAEVGAIIDLFEPEFEGWEAKVSEATIAANLMIQGPDHLEGPEGRPTFRASGRVRPPDS
jgi:hypothetical protein